MDRAEELFPNSYEVAHFRANLCYTLVAGLQLAASKPREGGRADPFHFEVTHIKREGGQIPFTSK